MARDSSGNYTLPTGDVVAGTPISADGWANPTMNDIANELTNSLDRNGRGGMLVPFRFVDGSLAEPGISWTSEPSMGFYRANAADMRSVVGGVDRMRWTAAGAQDLRDGGWHRVASEKHFSASAETVGELVTGDADRVSLLVNDLVAVEAFEGGVRVRDRFSSPRIDLEDSQSVIRSVIAHSDTIGLFVQCIEAGGDVIVTSKPSGGGADIELARFSPEGGSTLTQNGLPALRMIDQGVDVQDTIGLNPRVSLRNNSGTEVGLIQLLNNAELFVRNTQVGAAAALQATVAGDVVRNVARGNGDGGLQGFFQGNVAHEANIDGLAVRHPTAAQPALLLETSSEELVAWLQRETDGTLTLRNQALDGDLNLVARDSAGNPRTLVNVNADNGVGLGIGSQITARTKGSGMAFGTSPDVEALLIGNELQFSRAGRNYISVDGASGGELRVRDSDDNTDVLVIVPGGSISALHGKERAFETLTGGFGGNSRFGVRDDEDQIRPAGFNVSPVAVKNANYTFADNDVGRTVLKNSGGAVTYTCASDAGINDGARWDVVNDDTETLTIAQGAGVTIKYFDGGGSPVTGNHSLPGNGVATVQKRSNSEYWVFGQTV